MDDTTSETTTRSGGPKMTGLIIVIVLVALVGFVVLSRRQTTTTPTTTQQTTNATAAPTNGEPQTSPTEGAMMEGEVKEVKVTGKNFSFDPKEIRVKKGDKVHVSFTSVGGMHDWKVDEFNASTKVVGDGGSSEATFTADKAGTFEYYCSVGNHRQMGMVGKLIVE